MPRQWAVGSGSGVLTTVHCLSPASLCLKVMRYVDENKIVRMLAGRFGARNSSVIQGIGDDAAVVHPAGSREYWVITTDMLLEDVDFRKTWMTPAQLGHKSLAVNLSDLAAMGAEPRYFTVAIALPEDIEPKEWILRFYRGLSALARRHNAVLIGGDLSRSPLGVQISITALGETFDRRIIRRAGGRPGDLLYVTGTLGKAAAGLALLQQGSTKGRNSREQSALRSHRTPEPRCEVGAWLARHRFASCMVDLSDGLSMDLPRLCEASGTGAEISGPLLPLFPASRAWGCDPLRHAVHGGEDFELLFAVPVRRAALLEASYPARYPRITRIGRLCRGSGVNWTPHPGARMERLDPSGFDHFRRQVVTATFPALRHPG
ncbi:MAG: thiamine-monophosphate kinase [Acidobacteria bacterium]|nr:thiamine-monophosphate kinase [Acidobacteriota bacterium]